LQAAKAVITHLLLDHADAIHPSDLRTPS
jgi:hypothetical protein